jgi:hypothetical protein
MAMSGRVIGAGLVACMATSALANPLTDLLKHGGGACFARVYDQAHLNKHPDQETLEVRLSLRKDPGASGAIIRLMLKGKRRTDYIVGGCDWAEKANLDINDQPINEAFKGPSGLNCYALTSEDGSSAEEGGDFPIDLKDGKTILLYVPDLIATWASSDRSQPANFMAFGTEDQIFKLAKTDLATCQKIEQDFPWLL